ncbi:MAG TPA: DUF4192 domain-containing protein [Micrococcaceae bacterium]|jgi:hypothetical protein|nr:DUF4192 domain-containing protein [Micrococcaceae bacterium]
MTKLSISAGHDVIALIAHQLGYMPEESIVLLTMNGATVGATLRVDVPGTGHDVKDYAVRLCTYLLTDGDADGALFAVFTNREGADGAHPYAEHVEALMQELNNAGLPVKSGWLVTGEGWTDYLCVQECCTTLKPLEQVRDSLVNAELIFRGSPYSTDTVPVFPAYTGTASTEDTITAKAEELHVVDPHDATAEPLRSARALWETALTGGADRDTGVELVAYLQNTAIRDRLLADLLNTDDDRDAYGQTQLGQCTTVPTWERADAGETLLTGLLAVAGTAHRAPLLTGLGWISWTKGRGKPADTYLRHGLEARPGYRLAVLLNELMNRGIIAPVAKNRATAYRRS